MRGNKLVLASTVSLLLALAGGSAAVAQDARDSNLPPGEYQETCKNIRIVGKWLWAECNKADGSMKESKIRYKDCAGPIDNRDGKLYCVKRGQIL